MNLSKNNNPIKILFDTNIISYFLDQFFSPQLKIFLQKFIKEDTKFAISEISIFELLQAAPQEKEKQGLLLLNQFKSFPLDKGILIGAARLAGLSFVIHNKNKFNRTEYLSIYLLKPNYEFLQDKLITNV